MGNSPAKECKLQSKIDFSNTGSFSPFIEPGGLHAAFSKQNNFSPFLNPKGIYEAFMHSERLRLKAQSFCPFAEPYGLYGAFKELLSQSGKSQLK